MAVDTCSNPEEDQLFMFEMLVDRLNLDPEKIQEIGSIPLSVRLELLGFPVFEINEEEFRFSRKLKEKALALPAGRKIKDGSLDFSAGKSCLFPKKPKELIEAMHSQTVKVGVYKVTEKQVCMPDVKEIPVCKTEVPLSGCMCDQVAMALNDARHLPKPYTLRNSWNLIDEDGKPSGTILLCLRLTCLGKSVVTQFAASDKSFFFKSSNSPNEFQCSRVENEDAELKQDNETATDEICTSVGNRTNQTGNVPRPRSIVGLTSVCQELVKRDGGPLNVALPIKISNRQTSVQETAPKNNTMNFSRTKNPECNQLVNSSMKLTAKAFPCGNTSCTGGLCTGMKFDEPLSRNQRHVNTPNLSNYIGNKCSENLKNGSGYTQHYCCNSRMRGGGQRDSSKTDVNMNFQSANKPKYRECPVKRASLQSINTLIIGACKSPLKNVKNSTKPGCGCHGKLGTGVTQLKSSTSVTQGGVACSNKPCAGVDCLIRAFKETQDFVDSIGKVPGLVGLGLMDPTESPYFGRDKKEEAPTSCGTKVTVPLSKPLVMRSSSNQRLGLRNLKTMGKSTESRTINTIKSASGTGFNSPTGHHDHNAIHLDTFSLTSGKWRTKAEDKTDKLKESQELLSFQSGIEGESHPYSKSPRKFKKRKTEEQLREDEDVSARKVPTTKKKLDIGSKSLVSRMARTKQRVKVKSNSIFPGPTEDQFGNPESRNVKVSKRIMKMVRALRNPMLFHGHKNCLDVRIRVPGNMGWLWNTSEVPGKLKPLLGWKPGAISKFVWNRLQEAKATATESTTDIRPTTPSKGKRLKGLRSKSFLSLGRSQWVKGRMLDKDNDQIELPPTLHIHRKDGTYYVTMYPIKQEHINNPELQETVKPLQFKITKDKENASASSSTTASDMEIEFSPPAAISRYKKKISGKDQDTQVIQQEILDAYKVTQEKQAAKAKKVKTKK